MTTHSDKPRCSWCPPDKPMYINYHDHKWEVPVHDGWHLFEMLCLEGAQADLSWYTILRWRNDDCKAFKNFDSSTCIKLTDAQLEKILANDRIIHNRVKVWSVRKNAQVSLKIQKGFGIIRCLSVMHRWRKTESHLPMQAYDNRSRIRRPFQRSQETRHELCRIDHHLHLYASDRFGERSHHWMLSCAEG